MSSFENVVNFNSVPVGTIIHYLGNTAPDGYLLCDGSTYNIADYLALATHFETQFGSKNHFGGDGSTTFKVPNLQGEFLRCTGTNPNANQGSGNNVGVHQDATQHVSIGVNQNEGDLWVQTLSKNNDVSLTDYDGDSYNVMGSSTGRWWRTTGTFNGNGVGLYTSRPTNTSVWYCIKF